MGLNNSFTADTPVSRPSTLLVVAAALIDPFGRVLMQQRPLHKAHDGLWEFPGGKVEPGERAEQALVRELREELDIGVDQADLRSVSFETDRLGASSVVLLLYACRRWQGRARPLEAADLCWDRPARLARLPMPPLDVPLVARLIREDISGLA